MTLSAQNYIFARIWEVYSLAESLIDAVTWGESGEGATAEKTEPSGDDVGRTAVGAAMAMLGLIK
jgi:hypothetical protein